MTTPLEKIQMAYEELVLKYKEALADGRISFADGLSLFVHGCFSIVKLLQPYAELPFEQRKKVGVDLATQFYNDVVAPLDIPGIPNIFEGAFDRSVGMLVPAFVESIYEALDAVLYSKLD